MRIGIGGIRHETNTFSSLPTTEAQFLEQGYAVGESIIAGNTGVRSYLGGFIDEAAELGAEIAPSFDTVAEPSGFITKETLETLRDRLVSGLVEENKRAPLDGIALSLHGAGAAEGYHDIEGEILRAVRAAFGDYMPVGVVLDLHANVTQEMVERSDVLLGVKGYPHVDMYESGRAMFGLLCDIVRTGVRPKKRLIRLPWTFAPGKGLTTEGPAFDVQQRCIGAENTDSDLLRATFFHGFPFADVEPVCVSVVTMAKTQESADRNARAIAEYAWGRRADFISTCVMPDEALDKAFAIKNANGPVVVNEASNNPGGGAPGDGTYLLRELLKRDAAGTALAYIYDPAVVDIAVRAGVGGTISCLLGGKMDNRHGEPVQITNAYVKSVSDGRYRCASPMSHGQQMSIGRSVRLRIGNVDVIVGSQRGQVFDKRPFELHGIDVSELRVAALKSAQHFRAWWQEHAAAIIPCDPPGIHCSDLGTYHFLRVDQTFYPFDMNRQWHA